MAMTMMMMMNVMIGMLSVMNVVMILIMFKISGRQNWKLEAGSTLLPPVRCLSLQPYKFS